MKKIFAFVVFILASTIVPLNAQDEGQKIRVWQGGAQLGAFGKYGGSLSSSNPSFSFTVTDDSTTVPNLACPGNPCGWYKGFWILGDGNYKKYADDNVNLDVASKSLTNYTYAKNGSYMPVVYLTEKYHNDNPPEEGRATITVTGIGTPASGTELTKRLSNSPTRTIDIDYMHGLRKGYPMPFVVSYRKVEPATKVLFFYNSLKTGTALSALAPSPLLDYQITEFPDYFFSNASTGIYSNLPNSQGSYMTSYGNTVLNTLAGKFKNCISYDVSNPSSIPSGFEELRLFPVLKTKDLADLPGGSIPTDSVSFLVVLLGSQTISTTDPAYNSLYSTALSLLGSSISSNLSVSNSEYIRGIAVQNFQMGTSHDPNHLKVKRIEDLGNQKFSVFFELRICNSSEMAETQPTLIFKDLSEGKFTMKPVLNAINTNVSINWVKTTPWTVTLNNYQISGAPPGMESCSDLEFSIETDQVGIDLLKDQRKVLEVCVEFSAGKGDCSDNESYIEMADSSIGGSNRNWIWLSLITLLLLSGLAYVTTKKKLLG